MKNLQLQFFILWENSIKHYQEPWGLPSYTGVQRVSQGKSVLPVNLLPPQCIHLIKASRRRRLGVENCSRAPRVLSHGICFGQRDNSKHDASWGLKDACALATCFRFCYAWEPCDHCYVNKPGPDCCDKRYMAKSSLLPQLNCANYQTRGWGHPRSSMPSQATRGPQGSDGPVQPRTIRLMH